jgi:hypothetical protein
MLSEKVNPINPARARASAMFITWKIHRFYGPEPGYIELAEDLPSDYQMFLILVLLYSEAKRDVSASQIYHLNFT